MEDLLVDWNVLLELGLALGDTVTVCGLDGSDATQRGRPVRAWASGRAATGCAIVPGPGLAARAGRLEFWPAKPTQTGARLAYATATGSDDIGGDVTASDPAVEAAEDVFNGGSASETLAVLRACAELPLHSPQAFSTWGVPTPRGILLHGPAGTGKTMMGLLLGRQLAVHVVSISAGELISSEGQAAEERLVGAFSEARQQVPSLMLIDDLDLFGGARGAVGASVSDNRLLATLLVQLDVQCDGLVVLATTARPDAIDAALRRPGRFDTEIEVGVPDSDGRREMLRSILRPLPCALDEAALSKLAASTSGFVGADLVALKRHAVAMSLARQRLEGAATPRALPSLADLEAGLPHIRPTAMRGENLQVSRVSWDDVGGQAELKQALVEAVVWPLRHAGQFARLGIRPPRGVLLYGPPGCSKTLVAKALAADSNTSFLAVKGPELLSKWVGESEQLIASIFRKARATAPTIIFFDEIDALAPSRSGGSHVGMRVLSQLLHEMDGVRLLKSVVVIAATNRPDLIDPALLRPGRFDRLIYVGLPDEDARREILALHTKKMPLGADVSLAELAKATAGYSGAELAAVARESAQLALHEHLDTLEVGGRHFRAALDAVRPRTSAETTAFFQRYVAAAAADGRRPVGPSNLNA